ncbi:MAG TPA: hypothetical protein ENG95_07285 [Nitrospirae bacterium]|nr:hypothetical protein BMS3Abin10_00227 [bacterium BMS3Abin10]GBE38645.1 hypothetical protein BMS3Bbin08_01253 [bacterium BMS3Bbin08]HDH50615.1 hypothetical protein [Nitrospirota bacterium]HDO26429.1 hypothetical protein [Nitrospirota bacterium]
MKKDFICAQYKIILVILLLLLAVTGCGGGGGGSTSSGGSSGSGGGDSGGYSGSVTLTWDAPTTNEDGTPLTDLAGYMVHYGPGSGNYIYLLNNGNNTEALISNLAAGTWCFAVTAYDTSGNESEYSDEVCTVV